MATYVCPVPSCDAGCVVLLHQLTADVLRTDRPFTGHAQFTPGLLAHTLQRSLTFVHKM